MVMLYVLYEHATGYSLFKVIANEEIGTLITTVQDSIGELDKFGKVVKLCAFAPFNSSTSALENQISLSEGTLHDDLKLFLSSNLKKASKLGVSDAKLASSIVESLGFQCETGETILEIVRGIRLHFYKMISGLNFKTSIAAQLGLSHSYSRSKVKFNINKVDNMIIQSISLLEQLDKDVNSFCMRIREWYSYHFPELIKIVPDNGLYCTAASIIGDKSKIDEDKIGQLKEYLTDDKIVEIINASKISVGMEISEIDLINVSIFSKKVKNLVAYRNKLNNYMNDKMNFIAPNLTAVIGETIGAKLISKAGSLVNLAKVPASTVQILGAEKALFRAIKMKAKTPKYGIIFHSSFISRATHINKGRVSRTLAHKCSIATRVDCFSDSQQNIIGTKLNEQMEEKLKCMSSGTIPRKNEEFMSEAVSLLKQLGTRTKVKKSQNANVSQGKTEESKLNSKKHVVGKPKLKKSKIAMKSNESN